MFTVKISIPKSNLPFVHEHKGLWNSQALVLGKEFAAEQIGFAGIEASLNVISGLYEGVAVFLEPKDCKDFKSSEVEGIDFQWLVELLNLAFLTPQEMNYVHAYHHSIASSGVGTGHSRQQAVQCCGKH